MLRSTKWCRETCANIQERIFLITADKSQNVVISSTQNIRKRCLIASVACTVRYYRLIIFVFILVEVYIFLTSFFQY
jgi:hypothetical protein